MDPSPRSRCVIYGRLSDDRTGRSTSVDQQLDRGRAWAAKSDVEIVGEFRDDKISASRYARGKVRPDWQRVMDTISAGDTDTLWIYEVSRGSRDRTVWAALIAACQDTNTSICVDGKMHDVTDPDDAFALDLSAMLGVRESSTTAKRVKRDMAVKAAQGHPHGRLPYGWRRRYDPVTRVLLAQEPDPMTAPFVREAAERFVRGESLYAIAKDFDRRRVPRHVDVHNERLGRERPAPGPWNPLQVRRMISSPASAGIREHNGRELVADAWQGIISVDLYRQVRAKLDDPGRRVSHGTEPRWLLSGIATCYECGSYVRRRTNHKYATYSCAAKFCVSRSVHQLDAFVEAVLLAWFRRPTSEALTRSDDDGVGAEDRRAAAQEAVDLQATLDGWIAASVNGEVTPSSFAKVEQGLLERIADAQRRATPPLQLSSRVTELRATEDVAATWHEKSIVERREIVAELLDIRIKKSSRGARTLDPTCIVIEWRV